MKKLNQIYSHFKADRFKKCGRDFYAEYKMEGIDVVKKNVLFITHCATLGGAPRSLLDLISELQKEGYHIWVILPDYGPLVKKLREMGLRYRIIPFYHSTHQLDEKGIMPRMKRLWCNLFYACRIGKYIYKENIDIVHSNSIVINVGAMAAFLTHKKHVWHLREMLPAYPVTEQDFPFFDTWLLRHSYRVVCISKAVKSYYKKLKLKNVSVVYNGFRCENYFHAAEIRHNHNILLAGSMNKEKGQSDAIKAVRILLDRGINDVMLYLAGDGMIKETQKMVKDLKLEEHVKIIGFVDDLSAIREKCSIGLMCSKAEGLGRVTVENMLAGLVMIGTDSGATPEIIQHNKNGYLYSYGNFNQLADRIEFVWDNPDFEIIRQAQKDMLERFDKTKQAHKIMAIYSGKRTE